MKSIILTTITLFSATNLLFTQGYFDWPWPNQAVPDSIYSYNVDGNDEVIDIRQYFLKNSKGQIVIDSSFTYFQFSEKWWYGDKVESIYDINGKLVAKKESIGELASWNYHSIDSIFIDPSNSKLYHITTYLVDAFGQVLFPIFFQEYFLDEKGRDSLILGYQENMELTYKIETTYYFNGLSSYSYYHIDGDFKLAEIDSVAITSDYYIYQYIVSIDNSPLELQSIDTIFLDQKGRMDVGKLYTNDGDGNFEYVYRQKFYYGSIVSINDPIVNRVKECDVTYTPPYLHILDCPGCDLVLYNFDGVKVMEILQSSQHVELANPFTFPTPLILHLRDANGNSCMKKLFFK